MCVCGGGGGGRGGGGWLSFGFDELIHKTDQNAQYLLRRRLQVLSLIPLRSEKGNTLALDNANKLHFLKSPLIGRDI